MKLYLIFILSAFFSIFTIDAQVRIVDASDRSPVSAASVFDASGNMVGFTWSDGTLSEIPNSAYPITIRSLGYEQLLIERPENKVWSMTPMVYELEELVVVPVKRNVLKQTFYVREYFSMNNETDTVTFFLEHMADRFVPTSKDAKFGGDASLRVRTSRGYSRYQIEDKDSIIAGSEASLPSMLTIFELDDEQITAPESFKEPGNTSKLYEEPGKSGMALILKQNAQTFTSTEDIMAERKGHSYSPWPLKLLGYTMEFKQWYTIHAYRVNDKGIYLPKDLIEANLVIEADARGKNFRKILNSEKPIIIRSMIELYLVDRDYLSKEEAKYEYKNKTEGVKFEIPSTVPPLSEATRQMVARAKAESKKDGKVENQ